MSGNIKIGKFCIIDDCVVFGNNVIVENFVEIRCSEQCEKIVIGDGVTIESGAILEGPCKIGNNVTIGPNSLIKSGTVVEDGAILQGNNRIGNNCVIKKNVVMKFSSILTSNTLVESNVFIGPHVIVLGDDITRSEESAHSTKTSTIGSSSFIGAGTKIIAGRRIAPNSIVGAMSLVNSDISYPGVYVGQPIRMVRNLDENQSPIKLKLKNIDGVGVILDKD